MLAYALDLWQPAIIGSAGRAAWLANLAKRFGGVTPDVYVDFTTRQAYQAGQPSVLTPDDALNCSCAAVRWRDDSLGNWSSFAQNTLAYTNKGLRVWEARTNAIRNNAMTGAIAGTPGTLPAYWTQSNNTGIVPAVVGVGTDKGMDYIDLRLVGTTATGTQNNIILDVATVIAAATGQTWTASFYYKLAAGSLTNITGVRAVVTGNSSAGATLESNGTPGVSPTANWQRVAATLTMANALTVYADAWVQILCAAAPVAIDITLRVGWPQLEQASFASPPIRTSNTIRNNTATGAVVGTPGTLPTNWTQSQNSTLVPAVIGTGTDQGIDYIDLRFVGTTSGGTQNNIIFEATTAIAAVSGQTWTGSFYYKIAAGSLTNVSVVRCIVTGNNSSGTLIESSGISGNTPTASWQRVVRTLTLANASTVYADVWFQLLYQAPPVAVDITLRIGWPQLEQSAAASPPQRTVAGTVGVNTPAEVITLTNPPAFGGAYSLYAAGAPAAPLAYANPQMALQSDTGVDAQSVALRSTNGTGTASALLTGGTGGSLIGAVWSQNAAGKLAAALNAADQALSFNGAAVVTAALAALPTTPTGVHVGGQSSTNQWDGDITEFAIWATQRLSNANLISGTQ
jgi:hypothetical protein